MADPIIRSRIPEDLLRLLQEEEKRLGVSLSEIVRLALSQYFYAENTLQGPDAGFVSARKQALRFAHAAIAAGFEQMPDDLESAIQWSDEIHLRRQQKTKT